jgi:RalA-binding protein 1
MAARKKRDDPQPPLPRQQRKDSFSTMNQLNNISDITVKMIGSLLKSNEKGKDVVSFLLSVGKQTEDGFEELWRVQKLYSDFLDLDQKVKK